MGTTISLNFSQSSQEPNTTQRKTQNPHMGTLNNDNNITFLRSFWASSSVMGGSKPDTGEHSCCARESAETLGIRILCSVSRFPNTFSPNLLSISAGNGSLAPKSPSKSPPTARATRPSRGRVGEARWMSWNERAWGCGERGREKRPGVVVAIAIGEWTAPITRICHFPHFIFFIIHFPLPSSKQGKLCFERYFRNNSFLFFNGNLF